MSDLDDAFAELRRAVLRLEVVPQLGDSDAAAVLQAQRAAEAARAAKVEETAAQIVARVEAALGKIDQVLKGTG
jgi:hypothetical protein